MEGLKPLISLAAVIGGAACLGDVYGWKIGLGIGLVVFGVCGWVEVELGEIKTELESLRLQFQRYLDRPSDR